MGDKTNFRSFQAMLSLNFTTSITKIITVVLVAVIAITIGCYATVVVAKLPSPPINTGSSSNVYSNSIRQIPAVNSYTVIGNQTTNSFLCGSIDKCTDVAY